MYITYIKQKQKNEFNAYIMYELNSSVVIHEFISDSISLGSGVVSLLISKFLNEKIGRKKTLIAVTILQVISTCCVYFCNSFFSLVIMIGLANFFSTMITVPGELKFYEVLLF